MENLDIIETFNNVINSKSNKTLRKLLIYFRDMTVHQNEFYLQRSIAQIADNIGVDKSYISRMLTILEEEGIISITRVNLNDGYLPNFIFFDMILNQWDVVINGELLTTSQYKKMVISNVIK